MEDADKLIDRILYLDGVPNLQRYNPVRVGETVPEQLELELADRDRGHRALQPRRRPGRRPRATTAPASCSSTAWSTRRATPTGWRRQLHVIATIGVENYLAQQIHE